MKLTIGRDLGNALEALQGIDSMDRVVVNPPDALEENEVVNLASQDAPRTAALQTALPSKP